MPQADNKQLDSGGVLCFIASFCTLKEMAALVLVNTKIKNEIQFVRLNLQSWPILLEKNLLLALERGFLQADDLDASRGGDVSLLNYLLEIPFDISNTKGDVEWSSADNELLCAFYNTTNVPTRFRELEYSGPGSLTVYDHSLTGDRNSLDGIYYARYRFTGSFVLREFFKNGYCSMEDLNAYTNYFSQLYLLLSEIGLQCFKEKRFTFQEAVVMKPSDLASCMSESKETFFSTRRHKSPEAQYAYDCHYALQKTV